MPQTRGFFLREIKRCWSKGRRRGFLPYTIAHATNLVQTGRGLEGDRGPQADALVVLLLPAAAAAAVGLLPEAPLELQPVRAQPDPGRQADRAGPPPHAPEQPALRLAPRRRDPQAQEGPPRVQRAQPGRGVLPGGKEMHIDFTLNFKFTTASISPNVKTILNFRARFENSKTSFALFYFQIWEMQMVEFKFIVF